MSKVIKISVSDENYEALLLRANGDSLQDYIRSVLFPEQLAITPLDAVKRALAKYNPGDSFSVPEIYGEDWNLPNGVAGQFGRKFYSLVSDEFNDTIKFTGNYNDKNQAVYVMLSK